MGVQSFKVLGLAILAAASFATAGFIPIEGVFIQAWLYASWDNPDHWKQLNGDNPNPKITAENAWDLEAQYWKSMGVTQVIDGDIAYKNVGDSLWHASYPGHLKDSVEYGGNVDKNIIMAKAKKYGFKVYLGLGVDNAWWGWDLLRDEDFQGFKNAMMKAGAFARDLYEVYVDSMGYGETFGGFYSVYEIWNHNHLNEGDSIRDEYAKRLAAGFNILIDSLNKVDPKRPLLFSQFATEDLDALDIRDTIYNDNGSVKRAGPRGYGTLKNTELFWQKFFETAHFREQDKCLPMDAVGGGGQKIDRVEAWTAAYENAVKNSGSKIGYYANIEDFAQPDMPWHQEQAYTPLYGRSYISAGHIGRFARQIAIAQRHTKGIFNFAFSHYHSPLNAIPGYYEVLLNYLQTQQGDLVAPTLPKTLHVIDTLAYNESQSAKKGYSVNDRVFKFYWEGALDNKWNGALDDHGIHRVKINQPVRTYGHDSEIADSTVAYATATRSESGVMAHEPDSIYFPHSTGRECSGEAGVEEYCFLPRFHADGNFNEKMRYATDKVFFDNDKFVFITMDVWGNEAVSKPFTLHEAAAGIGGRYDITLELDSVRMFKVPVKDTLRSTFALDSSKWVQDGPDTRSSSSSGENLSSSSSSANDSSSSSTEILPNFHYSVNGLKVFRDGSVWKLQYNTNRAGTYRLVIYAPTGARMHVANVWLKDGSNVLPLPKNNVGYSRFYIQLLPR
ncbi:MAG: hypothetical protein MJY47_00375 [Fibrobacter sp.]|nr:hypothetical protein [Fibrobacter sp.]